MTLSRRLPRLPVLLLLAVLPVLPVLAAGCSGSGGGPTDPGVQSAASVELTVFQLVNQSRVDAGLGRLANDPAIAAVARSHSEEMRDLGYFSHIDPQGQNVVGRLQAAGIRFTSAAENLARIQNATNPGGYAHQQLMSSPDHRANILDPRFTRIGIGAARRGDTWWITENFVD
jgi:uncharacterized protein YkwD